MVAQSIAPVLSTTEAHSFVKLMDVVAPVGHALFIIVQQRIDEQMN